MAELSKKCNKCAEFLNYELFYNDKSRKDGKGTTCKKCLYELQKHTRICGIYKITSPTGRIYIGESVNIKRRSYAYRRNITKGQHRIEASIKKHGWENHTFEIVEECDESELKCRERYWQDFYDVLNGGLNCRLTECGELKRKYSPELSYKQSQERIGKYLGDNSVRFKEVINITTLEIFHTVKQAHMQYGKNSRPNFNSKLKGTIKNNTGYMYLEDYLISGIKEPENVKDIEVEVYDTLNNVVYSSITKAAKFLGISTSLLSSYLRGDKTNCTYMVYYKDYKGEIHHPKNNRYRKVVDTRDNKVYFSAFVVSSKLKININTVRGHLSKAIKKGTFRYYDPELDRELLKQGVINEE